jgi:hypothetical protein
VRFTKTVAPVSTNQITDFPQLTMSQFQKRITLSSFKIRQSKSYAEQIINYGVIYCLQKDQIDKYLWSTKVKQELNDTNIIAVLIPSRQKQNKKFFKNKNDNSVGKNYETYYKVFIQYSPLKNIENEEKKTRPYHDIKSIL